MNNKGKKEKNEELMKKIVIERLRAMSPNVRVSLGLSSGKFLNRDKLIEEVNENTEIGKKIVSIQMLYLRSLKKGLLKGT